MKKFNNQIGGHPFTLDDLDHIESAYVELFDLMAQIFEGDATLPADGVVAVGGVLSGTITSSATWTAGWLYFGGEFYSFPAQLVGVNNATHGFYIIETGDANDPTIYENATSIDVRVDRTLIVQDIATFGTPDIPLDALAQRRINERFTDNLINNTDLREQVFDSGWQSAGLVFAVDWLNAPEPVQYRVIGDMVEWRGLIEYTGTNSNPIIFTDIPTSIRPNTAKYLPMGVVHGGDKLGVLTILETPATLVRIQEWTQATQAFMCFDNIRYWLR